MPQIRPRRTEEHVDATRVVRVAVFTAGVVAASVLGVYLTASSFLAWHSGQLPFVVLAIRVALAYAYFRTGLWLAVWVNTRWFADVSSDYKKYI